MSGMFGLFRCSKTSPALPLVVCLLFGALCVESFLLRRILRGIRMLALRRHSDTEHSTGASNFHDDSKSGSINGSCGGKFDYFFSNKRVSWDAARDICVSTGRPHGEAKWTLLSPHSPCQQSCPLLEACLFWNIDYSQNRNGESKDCLAWFDRNGTPEDVDDPACNDESQDWCQVPRVCQSHEALAMTTDGDFECCNKSHSLFFVCARNVHQAVHCKKPSVGPNTSIFPENFSQFDYNTNITIRCTDNFRLMGTSQHTREMNYSCSASGDWRPKVVQCERYKYEDPGSPANGTFNDSQPSLHVGSEQRSLSATLPVMTEKVLQHPLYDNMEWLTDTRTIAMFAVTTILCAVIILLACMARARERRRRSEFRNLIKKQQTVERTQSMVSASSCTADRDDFPSDADVPSMSPNSTANVSLDCDEAMEYRSSKTVGQGSDLHTLKNSQAQKTIQHSDRAATPPCACYRNDACASNSTVYLDFRKEDEKISTSSEASPLLVRQSADTSPSTAKVRFSRSSSMMRDLYRSTVRSPPSPTVEYMSMEFLYSEASKKKNSDPAVKLCRPQSANGELWLM